jgi:RNA-directed DNA polymerase
MVSKPTIAIEDFCQQRAERCGIAPEDVAACIAGADESYCVYPLRRGTKVRWIEAPKSILKRIQRDLLDHVLYGLPVTEHAHGFVPGRSIVTNARQHVGRHWVVTLDIKDFFPSITAGQVRAAIDGLGWDAECLIAVTTLLTRRGRLPQGAPTSPHVANLVARDLDHLLAARAAARGWDYTRYADDLTFSGDSSPDGLVEDVETLLWQHGFRSARRKTRLMPRDQRQEVTGLVVNERVRLPKPQRRRLRAMVYRAQHLGPELAGLDPVLHGHLAFAAHVSRRVYSWELEQLAALATDADSPHRPPAPVAAIAPIQ